MRTGIIAIAGALAIGASGPGHAGSYSNDFSSSAGAAQLRGTAVLDSGSVRLTQNAGGEEGSLVIDPLDGTRVVQSFDASFAIAIGPSSVPPADGVSFSFGPAPAGTYGESGAPTGIVVTFDLFDNGETPTPPVIRIVVNGAQVAAASASLDSGGAFRTVTIHYDAAGLDLNYNGGGVTFTDAPLPGFIPTAGYQFTFGARTGSLSAEQRIDDVAITTSATAPPPVPTLGEWATIVMAGLLACLGALTLLRSRRAMES